MKSKILLVLIFTSFVISGIHCSKDSNPEPPVVTLKTGEPYTSDNSVVAVGRPVTFGIVSSGKDANLTNIVVKKIMPDNTVKVVFDSGMNTSSIDIKKVFYQSIEEEAQWTIQVMDKNRQFATAMINVFKDPNSAWGGIFEYPLITMGYQANTETGQFLNPGTGKIWQADSAGLVQQDIQIITYYYLDEGTPSPTFSSAGEQGGAIMEYYPVISDWEIKNQTKWDISVDSDPVNPVAYENCHNDSLITLSYDDVWGKRKFKWAGPGDIIPFMTAGGKKGLIRVISADQDPAGKISFSLKIQQ